MTSIEGSAEIREVPLTKRRSRVRAKDDRAPRVRGDGRRSFLLTLIAVLGVAAFLSPMLRSGVYAIKSTDQISQAGTPLYPADPVTFTYQDKALPLLIVPIDGTTRPLALFEPGRKQSTFIDPAAPDAAPIVWVGAWRTLAPVWQFAPHWENFAKVWNLIDYPRLLFNTAMIAIIGTIGTLLSCTLVAYGFARFRFPGRNLLFTLLIATIFLPTAVTIIPTYTIFSKLGWVGTWLPLLVPAFFANAFDVFLMRQYFMTIPTEMDEAAAIDGAGPFRTLWSVLLPQSIPVIVAVAIFHLVYTWNDFFGPVLYLSGTPDLQTLALGLSRFNGIHFRDPGLIQAGTLMTLVIPVVAFLLTQRFFTRGLVITGVEK
jgi:multiple sugar transport system permease protein